MSIENRGARTPVHLAAALGATVVTSTILVLFALALPVPRAWATPSPAPPAGANRASVEHGRYLVAVTGCNDCHTAGHGERGGMTPVLDWLQGSSVGFKGPWGTSYPANLRLVVQGLTEEQWLVFARVERRPPMPWFALRQMSDSDLRDVYRFIRSLGPKGHPAPLPVAPGQDPTTPYILFVPQNLPPSAASPSKAPPGGRG
jgi:mono/diheme cytochrome c family protein